MLTLISKIGRKEQNGVKRLYIEVQPEIRSLPTTCLIDLFQRCPFNVKSSKIIVT